MDAPNAQSRICNFEALDSGARVRQLSKPMPAIPARTPCLKVLDQFIADPSLNAAAVVDRGQRPIGLIERNSLVETFIKPYSRELYAKKSIREFMDPNPVIVDVETAIDDLAQIIIDAGMHHMVRGYIVVEGDVYVGMGTGHDLLQEITARKQAHLYSLAHFDHLTGLPNRLLFHDRLRQACLAIRRNASELALMFIDLDGFKHVNDSLGHSFGDRLLQEVARRLLDTVRENDTVSRLSGDEFTVISECLEDPGDAIVIAERVVEVLAQPFQLSGKDIKISASVGIALCPKHDLDPDPLLKKADAAMYAAKQRGRNCYQLFSEGLDNKAGTVFSLEQGLRRALQSGELQLYLQPQIELGTARVVGAEALVRWHDPFRGVIPPSQFIGQAEESGLIIPLGEWVLAEACRLLGDWQTRGLVGLRLSVNISPQQFRHTSFFDYIARLIESSGIDPSRLELELTESGLMWEGERTGQLVRDLRALKITLALDDFGTGYSSLNYLHQFPVDRLKIDRSFVREMDRRPTQQAIVKAIQSVGQSLGLGIVAEGVETQAELRQLRDQGCGEVQGFYFCPPLPVEQFFAWRAAFEQGAAIDFTGGSIADPA